MKIKLPFDLSNIKKLKKDQLLIGLLFGVLLLVITIPTDNKKKEVNKKLENETETKEDDFYSKKTNYNVYQEELEEKLKNVLSKIVGVGKVEVMITLKDGGETVVEKDKKRTEQTTAEEDSAGTKRNVSEFNLQEETIFSQDESNTSVPFVSKVINPKVEGVLVICEGGGNSITNKNISEAVLALFPIEPHKIMVVKMNQ